MTGTYCYYLNDAPTDITETWRIETLANGQRQIVSERRAPAYGSRIEVQALETNGAITEFTVEWENSSANAVPSARAHYTLTPKHVQVRRMVAGYERIETHPITAPIVASPLLRIFMGPVIRRVAALGEGQPVIVLVPWILDPTNHDQLLSAKFEPRSARRLQTETIVIDEQQYPVEKFSYCADNYDDSAEFWLDARDVLVRYQFTQNATTRWDVGLCNKLSSYSPLPSGRGAGGEGEVQQLLKTQP